jgi:hypothetical protein
MLEGFAYRRDEWPKRPVVRELRDDVALAPSAREHPETESTIPPREW